jgi:hypothetical protein
MSRRCQTQTSKMQTSQTRFKRKCRPGRSGRAGRSGCRLTTSRADNVCPGEGAPGGIDRSRARSRLTRTFVAVFNELADHAVGHYADAPGTCDRQVIDIPVQPESILSRGAVGVAKIAVRK